MPNTIAVARPIELKPHTVVIDAPRELVFQMLTSFRRGRIPGEESERSKLLSEGGNTKTVEFTTKAGPFTYTTIEEVTVYPPDRITFKHLDGPLHFAEEEFTFEQTEDGDYADVPYRKVHLEPLSVLRLVRRNDLHQAHVSQSDKETPRLRQEIQRGPRRPQPRLPRDVNS